MFPFTGTSHKIFPIKSFVIALRESWIRGSSDSRTISFDRTVRLRRYKIEDFVFFPDGTLLGVEGKLGSTDMDISSFVTDLV